jgi:hypothetical protein
MIKDKVTIYELGQEKIKKQPMVAAKILVSEPAARGILHIQQNLHCFCTSLNRISYFIYLCLVVPINPCGFTEFCQPYMSVTP